MQKQKRILIFELNWLGDILFSFPFLRAIRKVFPEAYITCVVVPRYADLLVNNPWINDVHVLQDKNSIWSLGQKISFIKMIRREKYDTCFFLKPSRIKTIIALCAGIKERIGFKGKDVPLTETVELEKQGLHRADVFLALAGAAGMDEADGSYEYFLSEKNKEHAEELLHKEGGGTRRMVAVNPGGNWDAKRWPEENFRELVSRILKRFDDVEVVITGAKKDVHLANELAGAGENNRCYAVAGKTGLNELADIFRRCELVISADSGPLHLASAVGATTIGLFGPTSSVITGPRGKGKNIVIHKDCSCGIPCYKEDCDKDFVCMRAISVDEVFDEVCGILNTSG
ncbi:MAG: lipopolysaccharide heptosyltransferase II [Candidatus Omnitrophota bacterium]